MSRPLPQPTPETAHFWEGTRAGELRLQRCQDCGHVYFPPRPFCPACSSRNVEVFKASGRGRLASYVINERPHPAFDGPYAIALVELEEGVRIVSNLVGVSREDVRIGMPVQGKVTEVEEGTFLPQFHPAER